MNEDAVLIVEDDADIRFIMSEFLSAAGHLTYKAEHGAAALKLLAELPTGALPKVILLDIMMPVMDGNAFFEILHRDYAETWAKIPIIVATAAGSSPSLDKIPASVERVGKPMDFHKLLKSISKYCE